MQDSSEPPASPAVLRAQVRRQSSWRTTIPHDQRCASFEISIGNERCVGKFLRAQLEWAVDEFSHFEFSIGDTLQVHNYVTVGHPTHGMLRPGEARRVANREGRTWVHQHLPIIEEVLPPSRWEIHRWDDWLSRPGVQDNLRMLRKTVDAHPQLADLVLSDARAYLARRQRSLDDMGAGAIDELVSFVLEELAVFQYQAEQQSPRVVNVYPGSDLTVFKHLAESPLLPPSLRDRHFVLLEIH